VAAWIDAQLRTVEGGSRYDVRNGRQAAHLGGQLGRRVCHGVTVSAGHDEGNIALSVVVQEPVPDIRYVRGIAADYGLELMLRKGSLVLRHIADGHGGFADVGTERSSAIDEDALHIRPRAQTLDDRLCGRFGVDEL